MTFSVASKPYSSFIFYLRASKKTMANLSLFSPIVMVFHTQLLITFISHAPCELSFVNVDGNKRWKLLQITSTSFLLCILNRYSIRINNFYWLSDFRFPWIYGNFGNEKLHKMHVIQYSILYNIQKVKQFFYPSSISLNDIHGNMNLLKNSRVSEFSWWFIILYFSIIVLFILFLYYSIIAVTPLYLIVALAMVYQLSPIRNVSKFPLQKERIIDEK